MAAVAVAKLRSLRPRMPWPQLHIVCPSRMDLNMDIHTLSRLSQVPSGRHKEGNPLHDLRQRPAASVIKASHWAWLVSQWLRLDQSARSFPFHLDDNQFNRVFASHLPQIHQAISHGSREYPKRWFNGRI